MKISRGRLNMAREERLVDITVQMCVYAFVLVMNGRGYGKQRLTEILNEFGQTIKEYRGRYDEVALEAMQKHAKAKGIEVDWI
jgi:hypothetical protein